MAIADRLNKLRTDIEDTYQAITEIGGTIPSDKNTNNIPEAIRSVYDNLPKVSNTGTNVSLSPTLKGRLGSVLNGNTYQETTTGKNLCYETTLQNSANLRFYFNKVNQKNLAVSFTINEALNNNSLYLVVDGTSLGVVRYLIVGANTKVETNIVLTDTQLEAIQNGTECWLLLYKSGANFTIPTNSQIEYGSTATDYEPYTGGQPSPSPDYPQEIQSATGEQKVTVSGKNVNNGVMELGTITGTTGENNTSTNRIRTSGYVLVNNSTQYTLSAKNINTSKTMQGFIFEYNKDNTFIQRIPSDWQQLPITFTTSSSAKKVKIILSYTDATTTNASDFYDIQIEQGNTATPYQPYQEPQEVDIELGNIELNKIGNYEDYIGGTPDNWVLYKNIGKIVLNGSETWVYPTQVSSSNYYRFENEAFRTNNCLTHSEYLSSNFIYKNTAWDTQQNVITNTSSANANRLWITIDTTLLNGTTINDLKIWLSSHNTEVLYVLSETQPTSITEEPLVSQLNELYYLMSNDDTTNIDVTGNLPMRITASAIKGE